MKTITVVIFNLVFFVGLQASAVMIPGWNRPISKVEEVNVFSATGELSQITQVSMALNENEAFPSRRELIINLGGEVIKMWISNIEQDGCGSIAMTVMEQNNIIWGNNYVASVVDHSTRSCKDLQSHIWHVEINLVNADGEIIGNLTLGADPESVFTIQGGKGFQTQVETKFQAAFSN